MPWFLQLSENALGNFLGVTNDAKSKFLGETDTIRIDVNLNNLCILWPVIHTVAREGGEWVQTGTESKNNVSLGNQFHSSTGTVVSEGTSVHWVRLCKGLTIINGFTDNNTTTRENYREFCFGEKPGSFSNRLSSTSRTLELNDGWEFDFNLLGPEVTWNVDLSWSRKTLGLENNTVQNLCHTFVELPGIHLDPWPCWQPVGLRGEEECGSSTQF